MCHNFVCTTFPRHCSLPDPCHIQREWENVLIARLFGNTLLPIPSTTPSNMEAPTASEYPRLTSIQHDSDLGRTSSYPISHYSTSTNITAAQANLKTILVTRVSFNDPNIVDVSIKLDDVNDHFVKFMKDYITKDQVIIDFLTHVRCQAFQFESEMYKPLAGRNCYPYFEYSCFV